MTSEDAAVIPFIVFICVWYDCFSPVISVLLHHQDASKILYLQHPGEAWLNAEPALFRGFIIVGSAEWIFLPTLTGIQWRNRTGICTANK